MFYKSIMIVLLFGATCLGQAAVQTEEQAQAEMQRIRQQMQTLQQQLDEVIAQTRSLREHAANLAEQPAQQSQRPAATNQPAPPRPAPTPTAPPDYNPAPNTAQPNSTADPSSNDMQHVIALLEKIDQRQSQLDAKLGVVEARQSVIEQQIDHTTTQQNTTTNNPYAYQPNQYNQPAQTVTVPANQVQTTMTAPRTVVAYQAPAPVYHVTYAAPPPTTVVYTDRYVYPRVWHGSVHVVPSYRRHGYCGYRWPIYGHGGYRYGSRVGFFGGINIRF